jgi:hypothetical protein
MGSHICGPHLIEESFTTASYRHFLENELIASFRKCFLNKKTNVGAIHWSAYVFWLTIYRLFECKLSRKVDKTRWANCTVSYVGRLYHIALSYGVV